MQVRHAPLLKHMPPRKKLDPWLRAEKSAIETIYRARTDERWGKLAGALDDLCKARQACVKAAHNGKKVRIIDTMEFADSLREGGRFLVTPPLVGRDASLIENALKNRGFSAIVLCREPITKLGLCPIVSLGSGITVRTQVDEPDDPERPTCKWFDNVVVEFGEYVTGRIDTQATNKRQLDFLLAHLSAIPTYINAYRTAMNLCNALADESV